MSDNSELQAVTAVGVFGELLEIRTAAILIIGDEILNGKIRDTNSSFFARYCFGLGVDLKKIVVVGDEEDDIAANILELYNKYDLILTSGGIGSTHDDITYPAIARAFSKSLELDGYVARRMQYLGACSRRKRGLPVRELSGPQRNAELRMATLPGGPGTANYFVHNELWVPIVSISHKVYILPGIPELFELLCDGLRPHLLIRVPNLRDKYLRYYVTTSVGESEMAPFLSRLQNSLDSKLGKGAVKIGSYPHMRQGINTVSIIGREQHKLCLRDAVASAVGALNGTEISQEKENSFAAL